jgi:hypothetical protein
VTHKRGLRRQEKHKQGYSALRSGIPHLWGKKQKRGGRHTRANLPWVGEKNSTRNAKITKGEN